MSNVWTVVIIIFLTLGIPIQLEHMAGHFFTSSDIMADHRSRKEYMPRQAQKGPETVTNEDEDIRRQFTLNEWFDSSLQFLSCMTCKRIMVQL